MAQQNEDPMMDFVAVLTASTQRQILKRKSPPSRLGIDGTYLLHLARKEMNAKDQNWFLGSVVPPTLAAFLDTFIDNVQRLFKPVVVFDGLPIALHHPDKPKPQHHEWRDIDNADDRRVAHLSDRYLNDEKFGDDVIGWVTRYLMNKKGVEVFTAPYLAWAQLASFMYGDSPYVTDVFGYPELLVFDYVNEVMTSIDGDCAVSIISKAKMEEELAIRHFDTDTHDVAAKVILMMSPHSMWKPARQAAMSIGGLPECTVNKESLKKYAPFLAEVDRYIRQCPIMTLEGECKPISKLPPGGTSIANLREFFFVNIHSEFPLYYFFLFCNVIAPGTLGVLGTARIVDHPPLVDTEEYRSVLERIIPLRAQIVFQLMQDMQGYHFNSDFGITWLRPSSDKTSTPIIRPPEIKLDEWTDIQDKLHDFHSVIAYERNATARASYDTVQKAHAAVLLKSLDLLGYFTHAAHVGAQAEVSSASVYATALKNCEGNAETGVLLIELIRTQTLNDNAMKSNDGLLGSSIPGANLACRIFTLVDIEVTGRWDAPVNPSLLAFNAVMRAFQRSLRSLTEVISTMLFITRRNEFPLSDYKKMATFLPFGVPLNTYAGVVANFMISNAEYRKLQTKPQRLALLRKVFPQLENLEHDLAKMYNFWLMSERVITTLVSLDEGMDRTIADKIRKEAAALVHAAFEHVVAK